MVYYQIQLNLIKKLKNLANVKDVVMQVVLVIFSGRGMAGQRSRSGGKSGLKLRGFKQLLKSTPKLRGF